MRRLFDLLLVTPDSTCDQILRATTAALGAPGVQRGRVAVQLRSKQLDGAERARLGEALRPLCRQHGAPLFVNGDLALARALDADGVQLPELGPSVEQARALLGPQTWLGASRHDSAGVRAAASAGADFVLVSPVFAVPAKGAALGLDGLRTLIAGATVPAVALGGIDAGTAGAVLTAGASAIAVIREVFDAAEPARAVQALLAAIERAR